MIERDWHRAYGKYVGEVPASRDIEEEQAIVKREVAKVGLSMGETYKGYD